MAIRRDAAADGRLLRQQPGGTAAGGATDANAGSAHADGNEHADTDKDAKANADADGDSDGDVYAFGNSAGDFDAGYADRYGHAVGVRG
jgi:hypothetical protein